MGLSSLQNTDFLQQKGQYKFYNLPQFGKICQQAHKTGTILCCGKAVNANNSSRTTSKIKKAEYSQENTSIIILSYKNTKAFSYETGFEKERVGTKHHYTVKHITQTNLDQLKIREYIIINQTCVIPNNKSRQLTKSLINLLTVN